MQHQLEENRITLPNLDQHSHGSFTREENSFLVFHLNLGVLIRICMLEMAQCLKLTALCENVGGSIERYLWACSAYAAVTPSIGIGDCCCL